VPNEFHPALEEYLHTIASLADEGHPVIQARVAERVGRTPPAVGEMLDRLISDGYLERTGRNLDLTDKGRAVADSVIRKHRLAERLLVDVIGLPWHLVHNEAGRWEHVISDDVESRLIELLGDPGVCPHGNPIPGSKHNAPETAGQSTLAEVSAGQTIRFVRLTEEVETDLSTLRYLSDAGFVPGQMATVRTKAPDSTLVLQVDGHDKTLALGPDLCRQLFVVGA
jgi:DtxR family transcriptional regulator, Mn-dependent transcriptional regulator